MKLFIVALALLAVAAAQDDKYTTKYDSVNIDEILKSERLSLKKVPILDRNVGARTL
ncbi:hypothetical protein RP20_CCG012922 [Aedes albopictus]|nr:hypothetical protein RP20_CCG012922 [Aedes albopictus]